MGAWIETLNLLPLHHLMMSHPVWVRGLKRQLVDRKSRGHQVAPCVGAWIETEKKLEALDPSAVAPCVGAWIETDSINAFGANVVVAPCVGAWIETANAVRHIRVSGSYPVWVRGLKLLDSRVLKLLLKSHPVWVRGLKQMIYSFQMMNFCRTLCGCVD